MSRVARHDETLVTGLVAAGNNVTLRATGAPAAGSGNITLTGTSVAAQTGQVALEANNDITIGSGIGRHFSISIAGGLSKIR